MQKKKTSPGQPISSQSINKAIINNAGSGKQKTRVPALQHRVLDPGAESARANGIKARRKRATQGFLVRLFCLFLLMGGVAYSAWLAPWARPQRTLVIDTGRMVETAK